MLAWLTRPGHRNARRPVRIAAAAGLLGTVVGLWIVRATALQTAFVAASLLLGLAVPWSLSLPSLDTHVRVAEDTVLIDRSHSEAVGHYNARANPIGPLYTNLLRSGFRVLDMDYWDPSAVARARAIAFVAPQRSFTPREVKDLLKAEKRGAVVLLAVGQPESSGSQGPLDAHGL